MSGVWAWLRKWREAPSHQSSSGPRASETAQERAERTRIADWATWEQARAKAPLGPAIKRGEIESCFRDLGYRKRRRDAVSLFEKQIGARLLSVDFSLKTLGGSDLHPPSQRLLYSASFTDATYAKVWCEIMGEATPDKATIANTGQRTLNDHVLSEAQVKDAIGTLEHDVAQWDVAQTLDKFRSSDPSHPMTGASRHLTALALAGEAAILSAYATRRAEGDSCGFHPLITDDMVTRALQIAQRQG